jgi:hypothetical protein
VLLSSARKLETAMGQLYPICRTCKQTMSVTSLQSITDQTIALPHLSLPMLRM